MYSYVTLINKINIFMSQTWRLFNYMKQSITLSIECYFIVENEHILFSSKNLLNNALIFVHLVHELFQVDPNFP